MPAYYLYLLTRRGGIAKRVDLVNCEDDDQARDVAAAYPHLGAIELWQGDRLVETLGGLQTD